MSSKRRKLAAEDDTISMKTLLEIVYDNDYDKMRTLLKDCREAGNEPDLNEEVGAYRLLEVACSQKQMEMIKVLLEYGADPNVKHEICKEVPLHDASSYDRLEVMMLLVENGGADVNIRDRFENTPLHLTCSMQYSEATRYLVGRGADINAKHDAGGTALHEACLPMHDRPADGELVRFLIENGADVNARNDKNATPIHFAMPDLAIVRLLVQNGANINAMDNSYRTPLRMAVFGVKKNLELAKFLIENGADLSRLDKNGNSLLHRTGIRKEEGDVEAKMVKLLIDSGCNVHARGYNNMPPLHRACQFNNIPAAQCLMEHGGANLDDRDNEGCTALHLVCNNSCISNNVEDESLEMAMYLIQNGAAYNAQDNNGHTPLHVTHKGCIKMMKLLMDSGADINVQNNRGETRLYFACEDGELDVVQLLASRPGANVNTKSKKGYTPLQIASEGNHLEVVWFLLHKFPWLISEQ